MPMALRVSTTAMLRNSDCLSAVPLNVHKIRQLTSLLGGLGKPGWKFCFCRTFDMLLDR